MIVERLNRRFAQINRIDSLSENNGNDNGVTKVVKEY